MLEFLLFCQAHQGLIYMFGMVMILVGYYINFTNNTNMDILIMLFGLFVIAATLMIPEGAILEKVASLNLLADKFGFSKIA